MGETEDMKSDMTIAGAWSLSRKKRSEIQITCDGDRNRDSVFRLIRATVGW